MKQSFVKQVPQTNNEYGDVQKNSETATLFADTFLAELEQSMAANPRATQVALVVFATSPTYTYAIIRQIAQFNQPRKARCATLGVCENLVRIGGHTQTV